MIVWTDMYRPPFLEYPFFLGQSSVKAEQKLRPGTCSIANTGCQPTSVKNPWMMDKKPSACGKPMVFCGK